MAKTEEPQTQLATRIPQELHRRLRVYCVTHNLVLMHFVVAAIEEKLGRKQRSNKTDWLALGLGDRAVRSDRGSTRRSIGYEGAGMNADRDLTKAERATMWQQVETVLPSALAVVRDALQCRVIGGAGNPLRNFLIRKLLVGIHDQTPLVREFETGLRLLCNREAPPPPHDSGRGTGPDRTSRS